MVRVPFILGHIEPDPMSFKNWLFCRLLLTCWYSEPTTALGWWQGMLPMQRSCPDFLTGLLKYMEILFLLWWLKRISPWSAFQAVKCWSHGFMFLFFHLWLCHSHVVCPHCKTGIGMKSCHALLQAQAIYCHEWCSPVWKFKVICRFWH